MPLLLSPYERLTESSGQCCAATTPWLQGEWVWLIVLEQPLGSCHVVVWPLVCAHLAVYTPPVSQWA